MVANPSEPPFFLLFLSLQLSPETLKPALVASRGLAHGGLRQDPTRLV